MNKDTVRQLLNGVGLIIALVVNALATLLPLGGMTTAQISNSFPVLFVPANYVFSIWGVIYIGLIAFTIYQALPAQRENPRLRKIGLLFFFSSLANALWLIFFQFHHYTLALGMIVVLLVILIVIYLRLGIGYEKVKPAERWLVNLPFSVYLGWLTVATIADASQWLYSISWTRFGLTAELWTVVMLVVGVIVSGLMSFTRRDVGYALVLVWAFTGIAVKQAGLPLIANTAWLMAGAVVALLLVALFVKPRTAK